jgi:hypothetical protein
VTNATVAVTATLDLVIGSSLLALSSAVKEDSSPRSVD